MPHGPDPTVAARLDEDRRSLLDLSLRNPLLNYRPRKRGLEIIGADSAEVYRLLVTEGRSLPFGAFEDDPVGVEPQLPTVAPIDNDLQPRDEVESAGPDPPHELGVVAATEPSGDGSDAAMWDRKSLPTTLSEARLEDHVLAIFYAARSSVQEQGVNTLFLALGQLVWVDPVSKRTLRAPLLLVPVELDRSMAGERFRLRHDGEDPGGNLSLAEKLRSDFRIEMPLPGDDLEDLDVGSYLDAVQGAINEQAGWSVDRHAIALGFFSFTKFLMYKDLDASRWGDDASLASNRLVVGLLGDEGFVRGAEPLVEEASIEESPEGADLRLVLDADSTQVRALLDARSGRDLVIQGPPGTGKSQTITNLIADAVGRGKTVLFVAEKLAALEVVKRRLDHLGLGQSCLELHSHKMSKKAVLEQVRTALGAPRPQPAPGDFDPEWRDGLRRRLDGYLHSLHEPIGRSGITPYRAIGVLSRYDLDERAGSIPTIELGVDDRWSAAEFRERYDLAMRLQETLDSVRDRAGPSLAASRRDTWGPGDARRAANAIEAARHALKAAMEAGWTLAVILRWPEPAGPSDLDRLLDAADHLLDARPTPDVPPAEEWVEHQDALDQLIAAGTRRQLTRRLHEAARITEAEELDLEATRRILSEAGGAWWRRLSRRYREAQSRLAALCQGQPPRSLEGRLGLLDAFIEAKRDEDTLDRFSPLGERFFGKSWRAEQADWTARKARLDGMIRLRESVRLQGLPVSLLDGPMLQDEGETALLAAITRSTGTAGNAFRAAVHAASATLGLDESGPGLTSPSSAGDTAGVWLDRLASWESRIPAMGDVAAMNHLLNACRESGIDGIADLVRSGGDATVDLPACLERAWYRALLDRAFRERPFLAEFRVASHERAIADFRRLDLLAMDHDRIAIAREHWMRLPRNEGGGQVAILRRELAKRTRHLPVRRLMETAGDAVRRVTPVFLMSPLSVATYLPTGCPPFDLVLFDEASQVRPIEALGALARGRQAVVVGDSRQLPPTAFFDRLLADEESEEDLPATTDVESILGLFLAQGAQERMLRWHYRSRHDSLIALANRLFYDGRLIVFPSPDRSRRSAGLTLRHRPETFYDRGGSRTNPGEAEAVAEAVMDFAREQLRRPPQERLSLGVATFSIAQRGAILSVLERRRRLEPACEPFFGESGEEPFFVKNLENVQGDERDVIFISVGYGRAADGSLTMNFGPLNGEGGERRLNVLITRARLRNVVFTNLGAGDLDPARIRAPGVLALRAFLESAAEAPPAASMERQDDSSVNLTDFERSLNASVTPCRQKVHVGVGVGPARLSLAITADESTGSHGMAVLDDGPGVLDSGSVRDRERLRTHVLEGLGWTIHRAWPVAWFQDPSRSRERLLQQLDQLGSAEESLLRDASGHGTERSDPEPHVPEADANNEARDTPSTESLGTPAETAESTIEPYPIYDLESALAGRNPAAMSVDALAEVIARMTDFEGPIHVDEIVRRLAETVRARRTPAFREKVESASRRAVEQNRLVRRAEFLWPVAMKEPTLRDRAALPAAARRFELIPPEELALGIERVVRDSIGISRVDIPAALGRLLGVSRIGEEARRAIEAILDEVLDRGRLQQRGEQILRVD